MSNWELVIVDDGSTDGTSDVVRAIRDPRIRLVSLPVNRGRGAARNVSVSESRGKYLAICDADDLSVPTRFERQAAYLDTHRDVGVVASQVVTFTTTARSEDSYRYPAADADIRARMARGRSAIPNQSAMIRREVFEVVGLYSEECLRAQDYEFFLRAARHTRFATLEEPLVRYRRDKFGFRYWIQHAMFEAYAAHRVEQAGDSRPPPSYSEFRRSVHGFRAMALTVPRFLGLTARRYGRRARDLR